MSRNGGKRKGSSGGKPASYGAIAAAVAAVLCYAVWRDRLLFLSHDAQLHPGAAGGALRAARVEQVCTDLSEYCAHWASTGECEANPEYMHEQCRLSCRTCAGDGAGGAADADASQAAGAQAAGVQEDNSALSERKRKWPKCKDKAEECAYWASIGECDKNERYMKYQCALSCDSCDTQDFEKRCRLDPNATKAVLPGQMNAMFERLATSAETAQYEPRVLSRDPWVLVFDRFMSAEEADGIVAVANRDDGVHFTASQGTDGIDEDGSLIPTVSSYRTSKTYWCEDDCLNETSVKAVRERVERLTGIPDANHEYPQILKYEKAQYYNEHHDYIDAHATMPCGPRVYTMFLYLSDVEEGGHTRFPLLNISVQPKRGRAVLWPSTLSDDPVTQDERTQHVAEPVLRGLKYSVNLWLHLYDFKSANKIACTG